MTVGDVAHRQVVDALDGLAEAADWYRRCLEDVIGQRPVRGLDEARHSYHAAYGQAQAVLDLEREGP